MNITQFVLIWIGSIICSGVMDIATAINILKDVADSGYVMKRVNLNEMVGPKKFINSKMVKLIPGINILNSLSTSLKYKNRKEEILLSFIVTNLAVEMTEEDKSEYQKKPTALTAFKMVAKYNFPQEPKTTESDHNTTKLISNSKNESSSRNEKIEELMKYKEELEQKCNELNKMTQERKKHNTKIKRK